LTLIRSLKICIGNIAEPAQSDCLESRQLFAYQAAVLRGWGVQASDKSIGVAISTRIWGCLGTIQN
jgi:hypothetical protein